MEKFEDPLGYLHRHLEPEKDEAEQARILKLREEYRPYYNLRDEVPEQGKVEARLPGLEVKGEFKKAEISSKLVNGFSSGATVDFREFSSLSLSANNGEQSLDLCGLLPKGVRLLHSHMNGVTAYYAQEMLVTFSGSFDDADTYLGVLHEIGHATSFSLQTVSEAEKILAAYNRYNTRESLSPGEGVRILEEERKGWAYLLYKVRPFLKAGTLIDKRRLFFEIHQGALQSYSDSIRDLVSTNWRDLARDDVHEVEEVDEDMFNDTLAAYKLFIEKSAELLEE